MPLACSPSFLKMDSNGYDDAEWTGGGATSAASEAMDNAKIHAKQDGIALLKKASKAGYETKGSGPRDHKSMSSAYERRAQDLEDQEADEETKTVLAAAADADESDDSDDSLLDDPELDMLRKKRLHALKKQAAKREEAKAPGCGTYDEITEEEFLPTVTKVDRCVCHFFAPSFERCKIMDAHLRKLAPLHQGCRFVSINAEKGT